MFNLFLQNISVFDFIFSSLVSVHIIVYNCTTFFLYFTKEEKIKSKIEIFCKNKSNMLVQKQK